MNYVFYDLETTGKNKDWSQIIQFGAILVNENLEELERFESKCNLKSGIIPEPEALIVNNNISIKTCLYSLRQEDGNKALSNSFACGIHQSRFTKWSKE